PRPRAAAYPRRSRGRASASTGPEPATRWTRSPARPGSGRGRALLPVLVRELAPQHLADQGLGQRLAELDRPRDLERREPVAAEGDELVGRRVLAGLERDEGLHLLALDRVRHADRGGLEHRRVGGQ